MRRLDAAGDRGAALAEYAELRSRMLARVGVGPSPETQALAESLRAGVHAPAPTAFPGRLLRADRAAVRRARARARPDPTPPGAGSSPAVGPPRSCSCAGEAGIGKSRLAARFAADAGAAGATVLYGACEEQALVPFEPFSEAVGGTAPDREEIESRLTAAAAARPVVLVLDDLHLADRNTLALLARVARGAAGERLLVIGAYRDADAVGTPLLAAIAELRRDCDVERVAVEGLTVTEVAELPDGAADPRARIHERTDGNPFFVRELARHLAERRDAAGDVPESVSDVVLARVARLSRRSADALTAASVLGESFDLSALELLLGADDLLDALDEASAAGLVDDAASGRYRFAHALTRDAVYGSIGLVRRAELHRRAAAALEGVHGLEPGPELGAIALHLCEGARPEDSERAVELAERAADWALARDAYEQGGDAPDPRAGRARRLRCRAPPAAHTNAGGRLRTPDARAVRRRRLGLADRGGATPDFGRRHVVDDLEDVRDRVRAERLRVLADHLLGRSAVDAVGDDLAFVRGDDVAVLPVDLREALRDQLLRERGGGEHVVVADPAEVPFYDVAWHGPMLLR